MMHELLQQNEITETPSGNAVVKLAHLTEVAALMAGHHRLFIEQSDELPNQVVGDYYILSRNRFNRWMKDLQDLQSGVEVRDPQKLMELASSRSAARSLAEQIMVNEMLARIWTMMLVARDRLHGLDRVRPLAHNVFLGHLSIRHKSLHVCLTDESMTAADTNAIDKLRSSTERWTDLLCCQLMDDFDLWQYAFDKDRALEFLRDREEQRSLSHSSQAWVLILAGMRHSFPDTDGLAAPIHHDDRALARLMISSFPKQAPEMAFWMGNKMQQVRTW